MINLFKKVPNYDFLGKTSWFLTVSFIFLGLSIISLFWRGINAGLDFRGGTEILLRFEQAVDKYEISALLEQAFDTKIAVIDSQGLDSSELFFSFAESQTNLDADADSKDINQLLNSTLSAANYKFEILSLSSIGPKIGSEIKQNAWYSVVASLLLVLLYMAFRFNIQFGLGAIAALIHDALITVGAFSLLAIEFDLTALAGILTLLGYSLNDSIVIFDRVRENISRHPGRSLYNLINLSVNETLSRTILTVSTTFIIILSMYIWGGSSIRGFSFAFLIGIIVGTYSSVFIASPVAIVVAKQLEKRKKLQTKVG